MFVREVSKNNGSVSIRIVQSLRKGNKVVQKTIRTLGQHKDPREIEIIKKTAEQLIVEMLNNRNPVFPVFDPADFYSNKKRKRQVEQASQIQAGLPEVQVAHLKEEGRFNDGIFDVFGCLYEQLGFQRLIDDTRQDDKWNQTLEACVLARVAQPASKKKTTRILEEQFHINLDLDHIYRVMDHVGRLENKIKDCIALKTQSLFKNKVDVLLFDVTTLYFESTERDILRQFGFSKDCKFNQTQVVLALVTTTDGTPMSYELFPGNTSEGKTLVSIIEKMKECFELNQIILVADRAMFNKGNLEKMDELGVKYVVAAKLKSLGKNLKEQILTSDTFKAGVVNDEFHWINQFHINDKQRLIVSYSSLRAKKDQADRNRLLEKLTKKTKDGKIKVTDLVNNQGTRKYIKVAKNEAMLDDEKIRRDTQWDGLHGVITNVNDESCGQLLSRYRELWKIEEAFRINKHDMSLRPIYHWKPARIRAHIAICYIAFALLSYARIKLKKHHVNISFERLRGELLKAQSSLVRDMKNNILFSIPSKATDLQKSIYNAFGLKRTQTPTLLPMT